MRKSSAGRGGASVPPADHIECSGGVSPADRIDIPGVGLCLFPRQFAAQTGPLARVELHDAHESPKELLTLLAAGTTLVLHGEYAYVDGVFRYCQRSGEMLVPKSEFAHIKGWRQRAGAIAAAVKKRMYHILVLAQGDQLVRVTGAPDCSGLQEWLEEPVGDGLYLIPLRRVQRILTDMRRAREGLEIRGLPERITILPHVYVPSDLSVPAMLADFRDVIEGRTVLDMGAGTGVLALLAAQLGASRVVATDINPKAVENTRINVERMNMTHVVEVRGPADLFDAVPGETFDVILFNAPWIKGTPQTLYDTSRYDPEHRIIRGFMSGAPEHLTPDGVILLQYSDISEGAADYGIRHLEELLQQNDLHITRTRSILRMSREFGARERVMLMEIRR